MKFFILLICFVVIVSGCGSADVASSQPEPATKVPPQITATDHNNFNLETSPGAAAASYELRSLDTLVANRLIAAEIAKLTLSISGDNTDLQKVLKAIIDAREREVTQLKRWRKQWYLDAEPAIDTQMPGMNRILNGLSPERLSGSKGDELEKEFISQISLHYAGSIELFLDVSRQKNVRPELRKLVETLTADSTIENSHLQKMAAADR